MEFYNLGDHHHAKHCQPKGVYLMAINTRVKRPPRKGEWYLSGAIVTAYKAPNDLSEPCHIAQIVSVKREAITTVANTNIEN